MKISIEHGTVCYRAECVECKTRCSFSRAVLPRTRFADANFCEYFTEMALYPRTIPSCGCGGHLRIIVPDYSRPRILTEEQVDEMVRLYEVGAGLRLLSRRFYIERSTVKGYLLRRGVKLRPKGGIKGRLKSPAEENILIAQLYLNRKWSTRQIGDYLGVHPSSIRDRLERLGVKRRSPAESNRLVRQRHG